MPVSIENYRSVSNNAGRIKTAGNTVHLSKSGDALVLRGSSFLGRITSWFQGYRSVQHNKVRENFIAALTTQYGKDMAEIVVSRARLSHAENMKKALTSREVFITFQIVDQHQGEIKEHNEKLAARYADSSAASPASVDSKISKLLSKMIPDSNSDSTPDMQKVREYIDVDAVGNKIKESIQKLGNDGKHRVSKTEAEGIAEGIIKDAVVEKYKSSVMDKYLIPRDASKKESETVRLLSKLYTQSKMTLDPEQLGQDAVAYLNEKIESAISKEMYSKSTTKPTLLSEDRIDKIVGEVLEKFTDQRLQAKQAVEKMDLFDGTLKQEVVSSATHTNRSAFRIIKEAAVKEYKTSMMDKYLIPRDASTENSKTTRLLSKLYTDREMTLDTGQLGKDTVSYLNEKIESAIIDEMYRGTDSSPEMPNDDRIGEIVEDILEKFTEQRLQAKQAAETLDIPDEALRQELVSFVAHTNISASHIKKAWNAGIEMQPHLKTIADADRASEKELKEAINGYMDAISSLGKAQGKDDISVESRKARSFLMMLAQGDDRHSITQELHRQITEPGPLREYRRAMNYYRTSFPTSDTYAKQEAFYSPCVQRAQEFSAWMDGLGLAAAEQLDTPEGENKILAADEFPQSPDIDDHTLTLMRNTGINIPTPERMNCEGEGSFCDAAIKSIEEKLASGNVGPVKDDICTQFLLDAKRSEVYFNGEKVAENDEENQLKAFCTDDNGNLDRNMMFAVSQIHQGVFGPMLSTCNKKQIGPIYGMVSGKDDIVYRFDKNNDGNISARAVSKKHDSSILVAQDIDSIDLDSTKSGFEIALDLRLNPDNFTEERNRYFPPEIVNATYRYSLYAQDE